MSAQLKRLINLSGSDAGFYILAIHSYIEGYLKKRFSGFKTDVLLYFLPVKMCMYVKDLRYSPVAIGRLCFCTTCLSIMLQKAGRLWSEVGSDAEFRNLFRLPGYDATLNSLVFQGAGLPCSPEVFVKLSLVQGMKQFSQGGSGVIWYI